MNIADDLEAAHDAGKWEMFELITSVYHGKQYYFLQENGTVYSRDSCKYISKEDAYKEFFDKIGVY